MKNSIDEIKSLMNKARYTEALEKCNEVLRKSPRDKDALILKAQILSYPVPGISDPDKAVSLLENACKEQPSDAQLQEALGDACNYGQGDYNRAYAEYLKAIEMSPNNARIYYALASLYRDPGVTMTIVEAIAFLQKGVELNSNDWVIHRELATRLWEAGKLEPAQQEYTAVISCKPGPDENSVKQIKKYLQKLKEGINYLDGYYAANKKNK